MPSQGAGDNPVAIIKIAVKQAIGLARESRWDEFFTTYAQLFHAAEFAQNKDEDQRQALKLMIMTRGVPAPTSQAGVQAYQAAWYAITRLINANNDPRDYELLGLTHLRLGDEEGARKIFQTGHEAAIAANDGDLCGVYLRHLSML
jgi:hypothetical protein